jgi:hypothetical protein
MDEMDSNGWETWSLVDNGCQWFAMGANGWCQWLESVLMVEDQCQRLGICTVCN